MNPDTGVLEEIDSNCGTLAQDLDFIYDGTVHKYADPTHEHSDKDTYIKFDQNIKKICNVENELTGLHLVCSKDQLPTAA
jgi:hypothetical protein